MIDSSYLRKEIRYKHMHMHDHDHNRPGKPNRTEPALKSYPTKQIPLPPPNPALSLQPTNQPTSPVYQTVGPKNLPVALGLGFGTLTAVSILSMLLFATLTPHHDGMDVLVKLSARMMTMVEMARPTSSPAEVM